MAPLVAPDVCRYAINQVYGGRPVVNIVDMHIDLQPSGQGRDEACITVGRDILAAWHGNIRTKQSNDLFCNSVSFVDLNSEDGSTGVLTTSGAITWPAAGAATGTAFPGNVSALVTKVAPGGGRATRNGRMYVAGLETANAQSDQWSLFNSTAQAAFQTIMNQFYSDIEDQAVLDDPFRFPCVVHTRNDGTESNPEIVYVGQNQITNYTVQQRFATQRHRLRK